jgi:hypothetical protein
MWDADIHQHDNLIDMIALQLLLPLTTTTATNSHRHCYQTNTSLYYLQACSAYRRD